ncbi:MAG: 3-hydroxyacyl-ACP dehydratase FabZ [Erysipelotrichaceae bacterium]
MMKYNIEEIKAIIPHRYPFLLIDQIDEIIDQTIIGRKAVTINEPFFQGHFPEKAVMPGVLIIESLAQTGAVLLLSQEEFKGKIAYFAGIDQVRFKQVVRPGDILRLEVTLTRQRSSVGFASAKAYVDNNLVCTAELMFKVGE